MNKIGWCDMTWNPVWGCRNHCEYCYARAIAKRFWKKRYIEEVNYHFKIHPGWVWTGDQYTGLQNFKPTFLESQFDKKFPKKPQRIFVGSMSEIYYWGDLWMSKILGKIKEYPQHTFQFLTKHPQIYSNYDFPKNCWLGVTVTTNLALYDTDFITNAANEKRVKFLCFEPILNAIEPTYIQKNIDWVIIGAETGNRKGKVIPNGSWVFNILDFCNNHKIPIYIKDNLVKYYSEFGRYKGFPIGR